MRNACFFPGKVFAKPTPSQLLSEAAKRGTAQGPGLLIERWAEGPGWESDRPARRCFPNSD